MARQVNQNFPEVASVPSSVMLMVLGWLILLFFCWPLALIVLILYPIIWLLLLPFRIVGVAFEGVFELLRAMLVLPFRVLRKI